MTIEITKPGKSPLIVETPVMPAAGTFGYGTSYKDIIKFEKLGAIVTNPVTLEPRSPANGTRVIPLPSGAIIHTGLPNPGLSQVIKEYRGTWASLTIPLILHLVASSHADIRKAVRRINNEETIRAIELGLNDDISWQEAQLMVNAATETSEIPIIVRIPMTDTYTLAEAIADTDADAIVVSAAPRGTARDPLSGRLVSGRIYGPVVKPMILRNVGILARRIKNLPIIGAGGIHSPTDARDYLEAGAVAVQVDSVIWRQPKILEQIARDLSGGIVTMPTGALPDEWHPGMGDTERRQANPAEEPDS